jgi:flagellar biogenesis protein FliO
MSANIIPAELPNMAQRSPFGQHAIGAVRWLFRRFTSTASPTQRLLAVEERVIIGPKKTLLLVRCRDQRFLIATSGDTIGPVVEVASPKLAHRARRKREA